MIPDDGFRYVNQVMMIPDGGGSLGGFHGTGVRKLSCVLIPLLSAPDMPLWRMLSIDRLNDHTLVFIW